MTSAQRMQILLGGSRAGRTREAIAEGARTGVGATYEQGGGDFFTIATSHRAQYLASAMCWGEEGVKRWQVQQKGGKVNTR